MFYIALAAITFYAISTVLLIKDWQYTGQAKVALAATLPAAVLHAIVSYNFSVDISGINFSFFNVSNLVSLFIVMMAMGISLVLPILKLIFPLLLLAIVNIICLIIWGNTETSTLISPRVATHIFPSIIAYSVFSLAAAQACVLWFQNNAFKKHKLSKLIAGLPPIDVLETVLFQLVLIGFILLSFSILSGTIYIDDFWHQRLIHKTSFSLLSWLTFITLLVGRFALGWRGAQAVKWTLGGYIFLMLGYFGSKLVIELILK